MPLLVVVSLLAALLAGFDARAYDDTLDEVIVDTAHACSPDDHPERGIQGDVPKSDRTPEPGDPEGRSYAELGYNCGLSLVGHVNLTAVTDGDARPKGNANMAWAGDCAYVSGSAPVYGDPSGPPNGVAVVDVRDPAAPVHTTTLRTPGATSTSETLHALDRPERPLLVVGQYGNGPSVPGQKPTPKPMDIYDVSDCAAPVLLETFHWPENIHNLTITPDGRYVIATQPLQVIELDPELLFDRKIETSGVKEVAPGVKARNLDAELEGPIVAHGPTADLDDNVPQEIREQSHPTYSSHEAWAEQEDGRTVLYLGGQLPTFEIFTIVDVTDWLAGVGPPDVISQRQGRGHSVRTATIRPRGSAPRTRARKFVLHSEESVLGKGYGCISEEANPFMGPSQPWLTDVTDPANPVLVSQFGLAANRPENCPAQIDSDMKASVHYHDVDDPDDTTFVMASMWNAGIRVFDVRTPDRPREVAYFNPGDVSSPQGGFEADHAWGHIRWRADRNEMWFATARGGFWVVELGVDAQEELGVKPMPVRHVDGWTGTTGATYPEPPSAAAAASASSAEAASAYYCTIPAWAV